MYIIVHYVILQINTNLSSQIDSTVTLTSITYYPKHFRTSLQFLTVTCWCFKEVYQSAIPASRFILNDHHPKPYKKRKPENCFKEVYQSAIPASRFILNDHHPKPYKNRKPENFQFIDVHVTSFNRKLRGRFPYKVILSNQTETLMTSILNSVGPYHRIIKHNRVISTDHRKYIL